MEKLFVYGTLKGADIRYAIIGKKLESQKGSLRGFAFDQIKQGYDQYPIIYATHSESDLIEGEIIEVDKKDLILLDQYEGPEYIRRKVKLEDGTETWVYTK